VEYPQLAVGPDNPELALPDVARRPQIVDRGPEEGPIAAVVDRLPQLQTPRQGSGGRLAAEHPAHFLGAGVVTGGHGAVASGPRCK
jgi:hypothetical protein